VKYCKRCGEEPADTERFECGSCGLEFCGMCGSKREIIDGICAHCAATAIGVAPPVDPRLPVELTDAIRQALQHAIAELPAASPARSHAVACLVLVNQHAEYVESSGRDMPWVPIHTPPPEEGLYLCAMTFGADTAFWNGKTWIDRHDHHEIHYGIITHWMLRPAVPMVVPAAAAAAGDGLGTRGGRKA
jgi:hypothetical protein